MKWMLPLPPHPPTHPTPRHTQGQRDRDRDRGFGCSASCVPSPLCGSCLSRVTVLARTPFIHEWFNDDQKMMVWSLVLESKAVPPGTRLGIVCNEMSVMVRQIGGDARHGASEPPGPAEPADTGTAGMAAGARAAAAATADR